MKKGDILIRLGEHDVADLQGFTDALGAYKPGDTIDIVVLRDGAEVRLRATLGRRGG
jgi:S1-C subfamily serine protease